MSCWVTAAWEVHGGPSSRPRFPPLSSSCRELLPPKGDTQSCSVVLQCYAFQVRKGQSPLEFRAEVGKLSVLPSWGCHNCGSFKQQKCILSTVLEARSLKSDRAALFPGVLGENLCFFLLLVTHMFLGLRTHPSGLCLQLHNSVCLYFVCLLWGHWHWT